MNKIATYSPKAIALAATLLTTLGHAAPTAEEIKQLGTTLTPWGAEMAGNKEGTIPPYTGGVTNPPKVDYATGVLPDPFAADKVQFSINAKNMDKYADKLAVGVQEMLKKYPTFRIDVYPTRRSVSYPKEVLDNTTKNATRCALKDDGETLDVSNGCRGGIAFPIPKTGKEVMWNQKTAYAGAGKVRQVDSHMAKPSGEIVQLLQMWAYEDNQLYDPDVKKPTRHWGLRSEYFGPTRLAGQGTLIFDSLEKGGRRAWSYQPSTKRVRLAPDLAGDTPAALNGGAHVYDEVNLFSGAMDRFEWKIIGKKEMFIPYNTYKMFLGGECSVQKMYTPLHVNPECLRWELHRVWHVQGTLKEGKRHVYGKRDYYLDEDSWGGGIGDSSDLNGKPYRVLWVGLRPDYVKHAPAVEVTPAAFDLTSGTYAMPMGVKMWSLDKPMPAGSLTPESLPNFVLRAPSP